VRILYLILTMLILQSCSGNAESMKLKDTESQTAILKQEIHQVLNKRLNEKRYSFHIRVQEQKQQQVLVGQQMGEQWEIKNPKQPEQWMKREKDRIISTFGGEKETMAVGQAGLVSPRDHLALIEELKGNFSEPTFLRIQNKKAKRVEINLDKEKLSQKLQQRLFSSGKPVSVPLKEMDVRYSLIYFPDTHQLVQCILSIKGESSKEHRLVITFG